MKEIEIKNYSKWYKKSPSELLRFIKEQYQITELLFIGQYYEHKGRVRFINVKTPDYFNLTFLANNEINEILRGKNLWVHIHNPIDGLVKGKYYKFKAKLSSLKIRESHNNPFAFQIDESYNPLQYEPNPKEFILKRYKLNIDTPNHNQHQLSRALNSIQREINKSPETFIFELLQNASDYPDKNRNYKVFVSFKVTENYLLFCHSGAPFNVSNVHSICSINESDKADELNKIGFKGIGFKSVFKDCDFAYINSGGFKFRFDKNHFFGTNPYQIIPIWTEENYMPNEVVETTIFKNSSVSIALKPKNKERLELYNEILFRLFTDDKILLFLPNIDNVKILNQGNQYKESKKNILNYWIGKEEVKIPTEITEWLNSEIEDKESVVPDKYYNINSSTIQFAAKRDQGNICGISGSNIYNYLPTKVNLGFEFLINGDFIPDGTREFFHDINWNHFLIEKAGFHFIKWLNIIGQKKDEKDISKFKFSRSYLKIIPNFKKLENQIVDDRNIRLLNYFKKGFSEAVLGSETINAVPFIPSQSDSIEPLSNTLIDQTGLAALLEDDFEKLTGISFKLIHQEVAEGISRIEILMNEYDLNNIYTKELLEKDLLKEVFQNWLKTPSNNVKLIKYFNSKEDLKHLLKESIILSSTGELKKASELYLSIPSNAMFTNVMLLHPMVSAELAQEKITLNTKTYDSIKFYTNQFSSKNEFKTEENSIKFWNWVYDEWEEIKEEKDTINSLKSKNILVSMKQGENKFAKICDAYLSKAYDPNSDVETIIEQIGISVFFVSSNLISIDKGASQWVKILKALKVKTDLQDLIGDLIAQLPNIDAQKHLLVGKEVFKYWKKNKNDEQKKLTANQISLIKKNLKIKCSDGEFRDANKVILSDHYTTNKPLEKVLQVIQLSNLISQDYDNKQKEISNWNIFFQEIMGCNILDQKQDILEQKVKYYVDRQDQKKYQEIHFELMEQLSKLFDVRKSNNLNFENINPWKIKIKSVTDEWLSPFAIHFSSVYKPILDLQSDGSVQSVHFLNNLYAPRTISKPFLKKMGIGDNYKMINFKTIEIEKVAKTEYVNHFLSSKLFKARIDSLLKRFSLAQVYKYTSFSNFLIIKNIKNATNIAYNKLFWDFVKKEGIKFISIKTSIINHRSTYLTTDNSLVYFLKRNNITSNQTNELKKTVELYSWNLSKFIEDKSLLPAEDYSDVFVDDEKQITLEFAIGIQQNLSSDIALQLISKDQVSLTSDEVDTLELIKVLSGSIKEEGKIYKLPNLDYEWKDTTELFVASDEDLKNEIPQDQLLHSDFQDLVNIFDIQTLSKDSLHLASEGKENVTSQVIDFFQQKGKFLAFKLEEGDVGTFEKLTEKIIKKLSQYSFYECDKIELVFPKENPIFRQESDLLTDESNGFYFSGLWNHNQDIVSILHMIICKEKITLPWFRKFLTKWNTKQIIQQLLVDFDNTPWDEILNEENQNDNGNESSNESFFKQVEDYIDNELREAEEIYDEDKIEDLKSILQNFKDQPNAKRNSFNFLAKLKLCKRIGISYNDAWEFNKIEEEDHKYFIHSARGAFAYIHPNELIKMRDEKFKMAIDYGSRDIRIYHTPEEIINLYQNFLMLYQQAPDADEIFKICEESGEREKYHFLIVDSEKQNNEVSAILKLMNIETYD
jgi:hypothetical protein